MKAKIHAAWHRVHPMPRSASLDQRTAWHLAHEMHCACRPIPASLQPRVAAWKSIRQLLSGGDRRSVAQSARLHSLVLEDPAKVTVLAHLASDDDWLVSMRAMDLLEKLAHEHADWVQPHRRLFIGPLADSPQWEIRLQIVRALPLLSWTRRQRARVVAILRRDIDHPQTFVRAWALDSLATLAQQDGNLLPAVRDSLAAFEQSGRKALATRAGRIRDRLGLVDS
jgi:hypothetical protein